MKSFDLNIETVLEDWDVSDALREIIANAIDEELLTNTAKVRVFKDSAGWHVRDFGRGLKYTHLTQNENREKLAHPDKVVGKFGVLERRPCHIRPASDHCRHQKPVR